VIQLSNYINGEFVQSHSSDTIHNINPATGQVYGTIPKSNSTDVNQAVSAAKAAFPLWSGLSSEERSSILIRIADGIKANAEELAQAESIDNGKPISLSRAVDISRAEANIRFFATGILHFASEAHPNNDFVNYTLRKPLGVVGCISPWNLPLYLFTWKIAPALAVGNCVVAKPSELTPYTAYLFSKICAEAGLPKGVLNIVHGLGPEAGEAMVQHNEMKAISFTGGTATGKHIASILAPKFKKMSLELGGKNANIIFNDAEIDQAVSTTVRSSFANQGQICLCGSRVLIQAEIYEKFKEALIEKVSRINPGNPLDPQTRMGALVSETHLNKVLSYVALAKEEGGKILIGGERVHLTGENEGGFFMQPTIIEGLGAQCRTNQEEIFGPVITLQSFETEEEAITLANATNYGLAASIWTENVSCAHRVAQKLETGIVWVNCWLERDLRTPFGGVKQSGLGREGGWEAMRFFTEPQNVCISVPKQ
jgi:aminomuconate-semialdehyde/2-hydroxymuconate-6-semialdehyde dehydrogenase